MGRPQARRAQLIDFARIRGLPETIVTNRPICFVFYGTTIATLNLPRSPDMSHRQKKERPAESRRSSGDDGTTGEKPTSGPPQIPYSSLRRFAQPIFDLFGIDESAMVSELSDKEADDHVAALETARLFWAYFRDGGAEDHHMTCTMEEVLFGPAPSYEEHAGFSVLVDQLGHRWQALPRSVRRCTTGGELHFRDLVSAITASDAIDHTVSTNGAIRHDAPVDSPDALAAFASPLLDDPSIDSNPDRISDVMSRAQDYWLLAQLNGDAYATAVERIGDKYSTNAEEKSAVIAEANMMVARFHKLFPHWSGF